MLNHAAAVLEPNTRARRTLTGTLSIAVIVPVSLAFFAVSLAASSASAADGIDLSVPAEPAAEGECPRLIQIKYPFLSCANGQIGQSAEDETWDNSRRIPRGSIFVELDGYWGPDQGSGSDQYQ
jgi:hypothetical protein